MIALTLSIGPVKQMFLAKKCDYFLIHRDGSFEYLQHMFWLRNKTNTFLLHTLMWGLNAPNIASRKEISQIKDN